MYYKYNPTILILYNLYTINKIILINNIMNKFENNVLIDYQYVNVYNNPNINFGLSFNNLSYTLTYEHSNYKKYLNNNSLIFNIEDNNTIVNIFQHNPEVYTYQSNNILFINDSNDIYTLNYNLKNTDNFNIVNNAVKFNILDASSSYVKNQPIYSYHGLDNSYIYSSYENLTKISTLTQGLYKVDENLFYTDNNKLEPKLGQFEYNQKYINNFVNKSNNILNNYNSNIEMFSYTSKFRDRRYTDSYNYLDFNDFESNEISVSSEKFYKKYVLEDCIETSETNIEGNEIYIKNTNFIIIDIPIEYEYKTVIYENYNYNRMKCPVNINNFNINITNSFSNYIKFIKGKSFVYDNKPLSINDEYVIKEKCKVSLYFDINKDIYKYVYNNDNNLGEINIYFDKYKFTFKICVDKSYNQFKILYHNYNYGFNFDKHGDAIGLLLVQKTPEIDNFETNKNNCRYKNTVKYTNNSANIYLNNTGADLGSFSVKRMNKNLFISYDSNSLLNILQPINNINYDFIYNQYTSYQYILVLYHEKPYLLDLLNNDTLNIYDQIIFDYCKTNFSKSMDIINIYNTELSSAQNKFLILSNITGPKSGNNNYNNGKGIYYILEYNQSNSCANNYYTLNRNKQKQTFNDVYNLRKSGLLYGDLYTPCLQEYLIMNLFNVTRFFNETVYNQYVNLFKESTDDTLNKEFRFLSNQFYKNYNKGNVLEYNLLTNGFNNKNEFKVDVYDSQHIVQSSTENNIKTEYYNFIWPMFKLPDFSIINSDNYIISFNEKENCEYVDYYINNDKNIYIHFKSYLDNSNNNENNFNLIIFDENYNQLNNNNIEYSCVDNNNNIYQLHIYLNNLPKLQKLYVCFIDSDENMNPITIKNENYRILCKILIKNENI